MRPSSCLSLGRRPSAAPTPAHALHPAPPAPTRLPTSPVCPHTDGAELFPYRLVRFNGAVNLRPVMFITLNQSIFSDGVPSQTYFWEACAGEHRS